MRRSAVGHRGLEGVTGLGGERGLVHADEVALFDKYASVDDDGGDVSGACT